MKILVIQTGKLGDMVCTTPVFRAIKEAYPESCLIVAGDHLNKEVLKGNPNIADYIEIADLSFRFIRSLHLDAAVLLSPNPRILLALICACIPKIVAPRIVGGFSPYATKIYRLLLRMVTSVPHRFRHYAPQEYLNMLASIGIISSDTRKELYFDKESSLKADGILSPYKHVKKIVISPSAGNKIKNWGGKNFAALADMIYEKWKPAIFVIGSVRDREEVIEMMSALSPNTEVIDLSMKLDIEELKAFISKTDLFIAVDTGPIYIAEAFGVPTVDIIGPMDELEQPPRGPMNKVVYLRNRKEPAIHIMNARMYSYQEARHQIDGITPDIVMMEVGNIFNSTATP